MNTQAKPSALDDLNEIYERRVVCRKSDCLVCKRMREAYERLTEREAAVRELADALEDATAALETVLAHFGGQMTQADRVQRGVVVRVARAALDRLEGSEAEAE